ncbi:hypothetical protein [Sphaerothrix gracilis]|uniref:hypothetical protein n=1 Tax=Sphaerothrix gracilis TaxID=3151835 RepID=UPI0031FE3C9B
MRYQTTGRQTSWSKILQRPLGALLLSAIALLLPACVNEAEVVDTAESEVAAEPAADPAEDSATVELEPPEVVPADIDNPAGQAVVAWGEVSEVLGAGAFILRNEKYYAREQGLLVVEPTGQLPQFAPGEYIKITGELQEFIVAELEPQYEWTLAPELVTALEAEYAAAPVIVAQQIDQSPEAVVD